ncbi:hypothetical protein FAM22279_02836 [Lacticaseibacillus paracasei]|nr:hypothetical protein FAM22279_02836 [Lacticaseibacillus paracasei]
MDREGFETYLNANSRVVAIFRSQALAYQHSKNRQRAASKRWSETAVANAVNKMVSQFVDNVYDKLRTCLVSFKNYLQEGQYNHLKTAVKGTFTVFPKSPTFV